MNIINELSGELAMAIFDRTQNGENVDRQKALMIIENVQNVLRPLSKKNDEAKKRKVLQQKSEDRKSANH